jgi:peptidoglycan/xylan/chitin deacetylase (PgdA/CDA1 family)
MRRILSFLKQEAFKLVTWLLFYSGALNIFTTVSSKFRPKAQHKGNIVFPFLQKKKIRSLQILAYHRVNDDHDPFFPALSTERFARQMEYLSENWMPLSLQEAVQRLGHNDLPERTVAVTFDDGYRDNFLYAYPILQRYGIAATIFLASGAIGSNRMIWHDRVFRAFRKTKVSMLEDVPGIEKRFPVRTVEEKRFAQARVLQLLWELTDEVRLDRINRLEERLSVEGEERSAGLMLHWGEVLAMSEGNISFGSHTISHPILSNISECRLREEIVESKKVIESKIKGPVTGFAYPVGRKQDFNDQVKAIVREAGYQCAVTTIFGVNEADQDLFELRRGTPWETDISSFAAKLSWYKFVGNG